MVLMLSLHLNVFADRGRPHISSELGFNRLLTDNNTPLRGVSLSWDGGDNATHTGAAVMPTQSQLNALSTVYGLNSLHVYLEMNCPIGAHNHAVGQNAAICDQLVDMTAQANLYLIITIGCGNNNGQIASMAWAQQFWNFYAPRYKDRTHVIYETHNEPGPYNPAAWSTSDWENQVVLYNTIRSNAPDTHIMTCSFMSFNSGREALDGIGYMRWRGVDFSNASVAFHGYETMASVDACISEFKYDTGGGMTPALICTEFDPSTSYSGFNNMIESHQLGWLEFTFLGASDGDLQWFKGAMNENNVVWTPDYGNWPRPSGSSAPIGQTIWIQGSNGKFVSSENGQSAMNCNRQDPLEWEQFTVVDAGNGKIALRGSNNRYVSSENGQAGMQCNRLTFDGWEEFTWVSTGNNTFRLRGNNNEYVSSEDGNSAMMCNRPGPGDWETFTWGGISGARMDTGEAEESFAAADIRIYPNPTSSAITIDAEDFDQVEIMDIGGRSVYSSKVDNAQIDVSSFKKGVYVVVLSNATQSIKKQLIVN
ncbi:MAG: T9SS type A sorting domain-containing protein [Marinoscillum sp.]|uniref:T9SS type A sorting domain-containing protein n=1 Tax=Marinoscillum sp. TaxID=2024838 RepID=UPI0032F302D2